MLEAIILAGGLGTRLAPVVPNLPKALAPIQGAPFLELLLHQLGEFRQVSKVILALGHRAESIEHYLRQRAPLPFGVECSVESTPLGTGGAILLGASKTSASTLLVINGDSFADLDLAQFARTHTANRAALTIGCREVDDASRYGSLVLDTTGRIVGFREKATAQKGWISIGYYLMDRELLLNQPIQPCSLERDLFAQFIQKPAFGYPHSGTFIDIGTPNSYNQAQQLLQPWIHS